MANVVVLCNDTLDQLGSEVERPSYARSRLEPGIVHLGFGGFHRAHLARYVHELLEQDFERFREWGIVGCGLLAADERMQQALQPQDCLYTLVEKDGADSERVRVIGSVCEIEYAGASSGRLLERIADARVRIVSLTVTENGYCLNADTKQLDLSHAGIVHDLANPTAPRTAIGVLVEGYARRRAAGAAAFTALSCDNVQHNGALLRGAVLALAAAREPALAAWIEQHGAFPNTMVDRITPVTAAADVEALRQRHGVDDRWPVVCESFSQFVVEDRFAAGRPALELVGVQFVADVTPYEVMKLRLLNASHLAVACLADLAGYTYIDELMRDDLFVRYMRALMDRETGATLLPVPGVDLADYKATLVRRFANAAIKDTVQRVATDAPLNTILATVRDLLAAAKPLHLSALCVAAWLRRVRGGNNDVGRPIVVRHPLADLLSDTAQRAGPDPLPLLSIQSLFGDLASQPLFVQPVQRYLRALYDHGALATLKQVADEQEF